MLPICGVFKFVWNIIDKIGSFNYSILDFVVDMLKSYWGNYGKKKQCLKVICLPGESLLQELEVALGSGPYLLVELHWGNLKYL